MHSKIHLIISGGSDGLGYNIAQYYSNKVSKVTVIDKKKCNLKNAEFIKVDLSRNFKNKLFYKNNLSFSKIVIINSAVRRSKKKMFSENKKDLDKAFSVSVSSPFILFKGIIEQVTKKKIYCKYINLGSILSKIISPTQSISYHLAKSGSSSLAKIFSVFFRSKYFTSVNINLGYFSRKNVTNSARKILKKHQKLSNNSTPTNFADIIATINYIISSNNNYLNGCDISVDQGISQIEQFYIK
jgi:NAD(P)-dependent dehydrogenase (short-subunit alcohol dehydrogenase family)